MDICGVLNDKKRRDDRLDFAPLFQPCIIRWTPLTLDFFNSHFHNQYWSNLFYKRNFTLFVYPVPYSAYVYIPPLVKLYRSINVPEHRQQRIHIRLVIDFLPLLKHLLFFQSTTNRTVSEVWIKLISSKHSIIRWKHVYSFFKMSVREVWLLCIFVLIERWNTSMPISRVHLSWFE